MFSNNRHVAKYKYFDINNNTFYIVTFVYFARNMCILILCVNGHSPVTSRLYLDLFTYQPRLDLRWRLNDNVDFYYERSPSRKWFGMFCFLISGAILLLCYCASNKVKIKTVSCPFTLKRLNHTSHCLQLLLKESYFLLKSIMFCLTNSPGLR